MSITMKAWGVGLAVATGLVVALPAPPSSAAPPPAAPHLAVHPSTGLADGQVVTVRGRGFTPSFGSVVIEECETNATTPGGCGIGGQPATVGPNGHFTVTFTLSRLLFMYSASGYTTVDCAPRGTCELRATGTTSGQSASVGLKFAPGVPLQTTIGVDPTAQVKTSDGSVAVDGTLTCRSTLTLELSGSLTEEVAPLEYHQPLFAGPLHVDRVPCHSGEVTWSAPVSSWPWKHAAGGAAGLFTPGAATVTVTATPSTAYLPTAQTTASVELSGPARPAHPVYYLALGESLAHGYAAAPGKGYTNDLLAHLRKAVPGLQLVELSCNDETTTEVIDGDFCTYGPGPHGAPMTQLEAAKAFLHAHRGKVKLITMDLGGGDLISCSTATCVSTTERTVAKNLKTIVRALRQTAPSVPIVADNYFDPDLSYWFDGPFGQALAKASVVGLEAFNAFLVSTYRSLGVPAADIQSAFRTKDTTLVHSRWGTIPVDVDMMCTYTDIPCPRQLFDADANAAGYVLFTRAFEAVVDPLFSPASAHPPTG